MTFRALYVVCLPTQRLTERESTSRLQDYPGLVLSTLKHFSSLNVAQRLTNMPNTRANTPNTPDKAKKRKPIKKKGRPPAAAAAHSSLQRSTPTSPEL